MKRFPKAVYELGERLLETDEDEGICSFGVVDDMDEWDFREEDVCHAALGGDVIYELCTPTFIVDKPFSCNVDAKVAKAYTRYVLEESPYAKAFAETDIDNAWRRGFYIYTADVDANLLVGALVAARMVHETPEIPDAWYALVKAGVSHNMAFLAAHAVYIRNGDVRMASETDEGHVAIIPSWFSHVSVSNFYKGNYSSYGYYSQEKNYRGFNGMWGEKSINGGNFNRDIYKLWEKAVADVSLKSQNRIAIFNHIYNDTEEVNTKLPKDIGLPILANILNKYEKDNKYAA